MLVAYLSHPLGEEHSIERGDYIAGAIGWFKFFIETTKWAVVAPWQIYATALYGSIYDPRRLVDQLTILERCDIVVMCGGWVSPHMREEVKRANARGVPVIDLTTMGQQSPFKDEEDAATVVVHKVSLAIKGRPRRVWVPRLTLIDLEALKQARRALFEMKTAPGEHDLAVAIIDRIIDAALETGI